MMKVRLFVLGLALCLIAAPARADLFGIEVGNPLTTFDGSTFVAKDFPKGATGAGTWVNVWRNIPPADSAFLLPTKWNVGGTLEDFLLSMTITPVTATTAKGSGWFALKDIEKDTIAGSLSGVWTKDGTGGKFSGSLSNVTYTSFVDNTFDGHFGTSVSMIFSSPQPWAGSIVEITVSGTWFQTATGALNPFSVPGGSIDMRVVPVPAAFLLGLLGMGVAGLKLRKFA